MQRIHMQTMSEKIKCMNLLITTKSEINFQMIWWSMCMSYLFWQVLIYGCNSKRIIVT